MGKPDMLQSMRSQRVRQDLVTGHRQQHQGRAFTPLVTGMCKLKPQQATLTYLFKWVGGGGKCENHVEKKTHMFL